jgi:hypothetical protein
MSETPMSTEMKRMCLLIRDGRAAFGRADLVGAEHLFTQLKQIATDDAARNCARLHLAVVFGAQHIPNLKPELRSENLSFIDRAETEYREVLTNSPTEDQKGYAERGLEAMKTFRRCA